jgi:hypothetical protein
VDGVANVKGSVRNTADSGCHRGLHGSRLRASSLPPCRDSTTRRLASLTLMHVLRLRYSRDYTTVGGAVMERDRRAPLDDSRASAYPGGNYRSCM